MKRSGQITLTLVSSLAVAACGDDDRARCVDGSNLLVADSLCARQSRSGGGGVYRYYYGGRPSNMNGRTVMRGGTSETASPVSRGAFGIVGRSGGS